MINAKIYLKWRLGDSEEREKIAKQNHFDEHTSLKMGNGEVCRGCHLPINEEDADVMVGYWYPHSYYLVHKKCRDEAIRQERYELQKIDSDCNDCIYFKREKTNPDVSYGQCMKYNKPTKAYPNTCTGHKCFRHRLDGIDKE